MTDETSPEAALDDRARAILDAGAFATLATLEPDGSPQLSVVWVRTDGDDVLVSTVEGRRKHRNLLRDPRAALLAYPEGDGYRYVEVRGTTTMTREGGRELIDELAARYRGAPRYTGDDGTDNVRVVVRLSPHRVVVRD